MAVEEDIDLGQQLTVLLRELGQRSRDFKGSVIVDASGLPVAAILPLKSDLRMVAAVSTLVTQSAADLFNDFKASGPDVIFMEGKEVNIASMPIGRGSGSLLSVVDKGANLGLVRAEMARVALKAEQILGLQVREDTSIREIFLIHQNGTLLRHFYDTLRTDIDTNVVGAMLSAVQRFVRENQPTKGGSLDRLRYGEDTMYFVRGRYCVVAVVLEGPDFDVVKDGVVSALQTFEARYANTLRSWDGNVRAFPDLDGLFQALLRW